MVNAGGTRINNFWFQTMQVARYRNDQNGPLLPSVVVASCLAALRGILAWPSVVVDAGIEVSFALSCSSSWAFEQFVIPHIPRDTALASTVGALTP